MRLFCPFCGLRDEGEFSYEGDASVVYPPVEADADAWHDAVYLREQPRGRARELWRHSAGCRSLLVMERNNVTHEVHSVRFFRDDLQAMWEAEQAEASEPRTAHEEPKPATRAKAEAAGGGGGAA